MTKKKDEARPKIARSELKNYSRSQQRYFLDMGYVVDTKAEATK